MVAIWVRLLHFWFLFGGRWFVDVDVDEAE